MSLKPIAIALLATALFQPARSDDAWELKPELRQQCLAVLRAGIRANDFWPAIHAAEGLTQAGRGKEVLQYLEPKLDVETDDQRRCGLARELVRAGDHKRSGIMTKIPRKADPHGHVHAAESLYKVGWEGDAAPLEQAAEDTDDIRLRIMAAAALAKHGKESARTEAYDFLRTNLRDETDSTVFRLSAWVLGRVGEEKDRDLIRARLEDTKHDSLARAFLEHALAALGDAHGRQALLDNFESSDPAIRAYAAVFAGESGMLDAVPSLIRQLDDENLDARIRAAHALLVLSP